MNRVVQYVPPHLVHQTWPFVETFLIDAMEQSGSDDYNVDQLKVLISQGLHELYVFRDENGTIVGAVTVTMINYPNHRVAFISAFGGYAVSDADTWNQFFDLLRSHGATRCQGAVRKSMARLAKRRGFSEKQIFIEADL